MFSFSLAAVLFSFATFISTFIGGQIALKFRKFINPLIALGGGTLIAAAMLDLIPETLEIQKNVDPILVMGEVLAGFMLFHIFEKVIFVHGHSHSQEENSVDHENRRTIGTFTASGLIVHSFLDGLAIGTGFLVNPSVGLIIAAVVLLHDFSDGINTVTIILRNDHKKKTAFWFLVADAAAPFFGVIAAELIQPPEIILGFVLAVFSGFFLYIGATDLLPEAHKDRSSLKLVGFTLIGALIVAVFRVFVH